MSRTTALVTMLRPVVDVVLRVPALPMAGDKVLSTAVKHVAGGVDGNFAAALAALGVDVIVVGSASDDPVGDVDRRSLESYGVEVAWDEEFAGAATVCYVVVDDAGERSVVVSYPDDLDRVRRGLLASTRRVLARGAPLGLVYLGVLKELHAEVVTQIPSCVTVAATLEASDWPTAAVLAAASRLDLVFVADETWEEHGHEIEGLQRRHGWRVVVTRGGAGSELRGPAGVLHRAQAERLLGPVVDTTGAGDAFAAAFCAATLAGASPSVALRAGGWFAGRAICLEGPRAFAHAGELTSRLAEWMKEDM